ncbi:MAG: VWA domain-containing protein [Flavobacteriales bacterium]|nr:VWA domain-containing protein [Flavobacteriales bacterium]
MSVRGTYRIGVIAMIVLAIELLVWAFGIALFIAADRYLPQFRIARPDVLYGLFLGPILVALFLFGLALKNRALKRFSAQPLLSWMVPATSSVWTSIKFLLLRHGLSFAVFALAGPQMGTRLDQIKTKGVDVVVAIDVSNSMLAEDLRPNRMEVAKRALTQLIERMQGDRLGIVVFAGTAYTQLPITADKSAAKLFLSSIGPGMVSTQGTALGAAIETASRSFSPDGAKGRAIIVISDGESFEDDGEAAATAAAQLGIVVNTIGLGSLAGAPIPERNGGQVIGFKKDKDGQTVMTKLNEDMLRRVAVAGKGEYALATNGGTGIETMVENLRRMDQTETGTYRFAGHEDRYQYFLAIGCLLIFAGLFMGERGLERSRWNSFSI